MALVLVEDAVLAVDDSLKRLWKLRGESGGVSATEV